MAIRASETTDLGEVPTATLAVDAEELAVRMAFDIETLLDEFERLGSEMRDLRSAVIEQRVVLDELRNEEADDEANPDRNGRL